MKNSNWPEVFGVCFVAFTVMICVTGWPSWGEPTFGTVAEWAGAAATTFAAVIALAFGMSEILTRAHQNKVRTSMLSELLRPEVTFLLRRFGAAQWMLDQAKERDPTALETMLFYEHIRTFIAKPALVGTRGFLLEIASLGDTRASAIARAVGTLDTLNETAKVLSASNQGGESTGLIHSGIKDVTALMQSISADLAIAVNLSSEEVERMLEERFDGVIEDSERSHAIKARINEREAARAQAFMRRVQ